MYIWHTNKLVEDFQNDNVSEKEKFKYILFWGILLSIGANLSPILDSIPPHLPPDSLTISIMFFISNLIIVIIGTYYCYTSNKNADNKDFVTRFMCISIPIYIKLFVYFIPIFTFFFIIAQEDFHEFISFFLPCSFEIAYYYLLVNKFKLFIIENTAQTIAGNNI